MKELLLGCIYLMWGHFRTWMLSGRRLCTLLLLGFGLFKGIAELVFCKGVFGVGVW